MKTELHSKISPGFSIGLLTAFGLIGYFLLMNFAGLTAVIEFRLFNFVILFSGVFWAMKRETKFSPDSNDLGALGTGCLTVLTAVSIFSSFLYLYLLADNGLMVEICKHSSVGSFLTPETAAIGALAEGISSGIIMAYVFISFSKKESNQSLKN